MKLWKMEMATDISGSNLLVLHGLAQNAKEAVDKAFQTKDAKTYKEEGVYFSKITKVGEVDF